MIEVCRTIRTSAEQIFAVLADGWSYASWVVGAAHIRAVDEGWPAVNTRVHHRVGPWPMQLNDRTATRPAGQPACWARTRRFSRPDRYGQNPGHSISAPTSPRLCPMPSPNRRMVPELGRTAGQQVPLARTGKKVNSGFPVVVVRYKRPGPRPGACWTSSSTGSKGRSGRRRWRQADTRR